MSRGPAALCATAAAIALAIAFAAEWYGGLVPCALCLLERWPYRVALALGLLAFAVPASARRAVLALGVISYAGAALFAATHVGVEVGAWPSPLPECAAPSLTASTLAGRLAQMPALPGKPCDQPTYLVPGLPISMAMLNLMFALALTIVLAIAALRPTRRRGPA